MGLVLYANLDPMLQEFQPGDFLIFQLEAGYGLMRVLAVEANDGDAIWHIAAYGDLFLDTQTAEASIDRPEGLLVEIPHVALTNRAFESTQVAKLTNVPVTESELNLCKAWLADDVRHVADRSVRLLLGLR